MVVEEQFNAITRWQWRSIVPTPRCLIALLKKSLAHSELVISVYTASFPSWDYRAVLAEACIARAPGPFVERYNVNRYSGTSHSTDAHDPSAHGFMQG